MSHNSDGQPELTIPWGVKLDDTTTGVAEESNGQLQLPVKLHGSRAKTAFALRHNCEVMLRGNSRGTIQKVQYWDEKAGELKERMAYISTDPEFLNSAAFLTLTVGDWVTDEFGNERFEQVFDAAEASRRINNLNRTILPEIFGKAIVVTERHKNKAVHFHLVGILRSHTDIRTNFDFEAFHAALNARAKGSINNAAEIRYKTSANEELLRLWAFLREKLPAYGFGRAQLTPIEKTGEAVAAYVAKYIEKNLWNRLEEDKHKKLVRYIGWEKSQLRPNDFAWAGKKATAWRWKVRECAALIGVNTPEQAKEALGSRWAFTLDLIRRAPGDDTNNWMVWTDQYDADWAEETLYKFCTIDWQMKRLFEGADISTLDRERFFNSENGYWFEKAIEEQTEAGFFQN